MATYSTGYNYDRGTGQVSRQDPNGTVRPEEATEGAVRDGLSYGGHAARVVRGPDGKTTVDYGGSGLNEAVNRYQGLGEAAANRQAFQADYNTADQARGQANRSRGEQLRALDSMQGAAEGNAPSATTGLGNAMASQTMEGQLRASAGARGGLAQAVAGRQASMAAAGQYASNASSLAGMRAGELGAARDAYSGGAGGIRGMDLGEQGMLQGRQLAQGDAEMAQRGLNQQQQMGYEGLAYGARQAQLNASNAQDETDNGIMQNSLRLQNEDANRRQAMYGTAASTAGAGLSAIAGMYRQGGGGGQDDGYSGGIIRKNPYGDG